MTHLLSLALLLALFAMPARAQYNEGIAAYERGDYAAALREFRPLAAQGNAFAQNNLGTMYAQGLGVPQDYAEAAEWFRRAADQGESYAQNNLGYLYAEGLGVPRDYVQAYLWFSLARETSNRELVAARMTAAQIEEAERLVQAWQGKPEKPQ